MKLAFTPQQLAVGKRIYENQCFACHGPGAVSSGVLPDLRRSGALPDKDLWNKIVYGGLLKGNGMVSFAKVLTADEIESIRGYVSQRAEVLQQQEDKKP